MATPPIPGKWAYSHDGEMYEGDYDSKEEAIEQGWAGYEFLDKIWVGRWMKVKPIDQLIDIREFLRPILEYVRDNGLVLLREPDPSEFDFQTLKRDIAIVTEEFFESEGFEWPYWAIDPLTIIGSGSPPDKTDDEQ